jgi:hypothetical protein
VLLLLARTTPVPSSSPSHPEQEVAERERLGEPPDAEPAAAAASWLPPQLGVGPPAVVIPVPQALLLPRRPALLPFAALLQAAAAAAAAAAPGPRPKPFSRLALPTGPDASGPLPSIFLLPMPPLLRVLLPGAADRMLLPGAPCAPLARFNPAMLLLLPGPPCPPWGLLAA